MKTYCKDKNLLDVSFVVESILDFMDSNKCRKRWARWIFGKFSGKRAAYVRKHLHPGDSFLEETAQVIAFEMVDAIARRRIRENILERSYNAPVIRYVPINDSGSGKDRVLGIECPMMKFYENLFRYAADPLFRAKVGTYQVAAIKGKGQRFGVRAFRKWLGGDTRGTRYEAQMDIRKCYPSIPHDKILARLHRDIHKNADMIYLIDTMFQIYRENPSPNTAYGADHGILIGSPASKDLCNYYMSQVYHFACENLRSEKKRRGKASRLISHILLFMDDIHMFGPSKKEMHKAVQEIIRFTRDQMGIEVKPSWRVYKVSYTDKDGKEHGSRPDCMGNVFRRIGQTEKVYPGGVKMIFQKVIVTIRGKVFLRARRKIHRMGKKIRRGERVSLKLARGVASQYGVFKSSNSYKIRRRYADACAKCASKIVSDMEKKKPYNQKNYVRLWRKAYA